MNVHLMRTREERERIAESAFVLRDRSHIDPSEFGLSYWLSGVREWGDIVNGLDDPIGFVSSSDGATS